MSRKRKEGLPQTRQERAPLDDDTLKLAMTSSDTSEEISTPPKMYELRRLCGAKLSRVGGAAVHERYKGPRTQLSKLIGLRKLHAYRCAALRTNLHEVSQCESDGPRKKGEDDFPANAYDRV